jgi:uncharacterized protein (TIGR04255 family)
VVISPRKDETATPNNNAASSADEVSLPVFDQPPVIEVAVSVQFTPLPSLDAARLGLAWSRFRSKFPRVESKPPLPRTEERFDEPTVPRLQLKIETDLAAPRLWLLDDAGTRLLQVQRDRFAFNWRKAESAKAYPRYTELRKEFLQNYDLFQAFLTDEKLGDLVPDQVELTYVNHIAAGESNDKRMPLERCLRLWSGEPAGSILPQAEAVTLTSQYVFREEGRAVGRLHVGVQPRLYMATGRPLYHVQLIARGAPNPSSNTDGVLAMLDRGHVWIVRAFTDITTAEMHQLWQRQQ